MKNGHVQSQNRHGPEWAWMDPACWHQEHLLPGLASASIHRTAERLEFVMGAPSVVCAT